MPSDAYMKLDGFRGETKDSFEKGWSAFEISTFSFEHKPDDSESGGTASKPPATAGKSSSAQSGSSKPEFTIQKGLDSASPNIIRRCCDRKTIKWAMVYFREMGDPNRIPYLVLEFTNLTIKDFKWELDPGAGGDEALKVESVTFDFETILIKYAKQLPTGEHAPAHLGMWNFNDNSGNVDPISGDDFLGEVNE